jgi:hypothetical protein
MIRFTLPVAFLICALATPMAFAQMRYKCVDGRGHTIYSDRPCEPGPLPAPPKPKLQRDAAAQTTAATAPTQPAPNIATNGKLTEASVKTVLEYSLDLSEKLDFRGQCALAAPDLKFSITDKTRSPVEQQSGGRKEICDLEKEGAIAAQAAGMQFSSKIQKLTIRLNSDNTQAATNYETVTAISVQGQTILRQLCTQQDTLAVYDGKILFKAANAVCKLQTP